MATPSNIRYRFPFDGSIQGPMPILRATYLPIGVRLEDVDYLNSHIPNKAITPEKRSSFWNIVAPFARTMGFYLLRLAIKEILLRMRRRDADPHVDESDNGQVPGQIPGPRRGSAGPLAIPGHIRALARHTRSHSCTFQEIGRELQMIEENLRNDCLEMITSNEHPSPEEDEDEEELPMEEPLPRPPPGRRSSAAGVPMIRRYR